MKKLILFIIVLAAIFLLRDQLNPYWIKFHTQVDADDPIGWLVERRDTLYRDLPEMNFDTAIASLMHFEAKIKESLFGIDETAADEEQRRSYHRNLICELAVVYKKLAMAHMGKGEDELYVAYMQKSRDELAECAHFREP
ncbi:MAG: hypothetical protein V2I36_18585 [Desulfopila sp.]|nr:hypothetical protein [Desulfopila sp.]